MRPDVGVRSPWHRRISTLLPAPFGPEDHGSRARRELARHAVEDRAPAGDERYVLENQRQHGRLPVAAHGRRLDELRRGVDDEHDGDEYEPETERERQIALARLERDRGRHHARHAVDVAADDHHGADLGRGAAEPASTTVTSE